MLQSNEKRVWYRNVDANINPAPGVIFMIARLAAYKCPTMIMPDWGNLFGCKFDKTKP